MATKGNKSVDTPEPQPDADEIQETQTPPLKPFSKTESRKSSGPGDQFFRPAIHRHVGEIPGIQRHGEGISARFGDNSSCLTVGKNISLSGEITSCDKLVVEGNVKVKLSNAKMIEVLSKGFFKWSAQVETAEINGYFDGELEVKGVLTILKEGRVSGSVRYGKIVIESGGEISGDMASFDSLNGSVKSKDKK